MRICSNNGRLRYHSCARPACAGMVVPAGGGADMPGLVVYPPVLTHERRGDMRIYIIKLPRLISRLIAKIKGE